MSIEKVGKPGHKIYFYYKSTSKLNKFLKISMSSSMCFDVLIFYIKGY